MTITLGPLDYAILAAYFLFVVAVGWMVRRRVRTSEDFLTSHRSVPVVDHQPRIIWRRIWERRK